MDMASLAVPPFFVLTAVMFATPVASGADSLSAALGMESLPVHVRPLLSTGQDHDALTINIGEGETRNWVDDIEVGPDTNIYVNVASNGALTISGSIAAGALVKRGPGRVAIAGRVNRIAGGIFCEEGIMSVQDASFLEETGSIHVSDGTFEFAGDGSGMQQTLPCQLVCSASRVSDTLDGIVDLKIESPLVITNVLMESGCIFKRGVAALSFAPAPGEPMSLTVSPGYGGDAGDMGDLSAADWRPPAGSAYGGFNILEGEVAVHGDSSSFVDMSYTVNVGMKAANVRARPVLSIDGVTATVGSANNSFLQCIWNGLAGQYADFVVSNAASVVTKNFRCLSFGHTSVVIDGANWTLTRWLFPYGGENFRTMFRFVNGARVYADCSESTATTYGECGFAVSNSVFAKNMSLACYPVDTRDTSGYWVFGPGSTNAITGFLRRHKENNRSRYELRFEGGVWKTDVSKWQPMCFIDATNVVMRTTCESGLVLQVDSGTLYAGRAIDGPGGMAKTGAGRLEFMTQGTWTGSESFSGGQADWTETKLEDPVSLAFGGLFDVREGSAFVERGACRTGGAYRAGLGASIDFGGNDLGSGVTFSGAGSFSNFTATAATIYVPLSDDLVAIDGAPSFSSATFGGSMLVDFGPLRVPVRGARIVVATFLTGTPSLATWSTSAIPKGFAASLRLEGLSVVAYIQHKGLTIRLK